LLASCPSGLPPLPVLEENRWGLTEPVFTGWISFLLPERQVID